MKPHTTVKYTPVSDTCFKLVATYYAYTSFSRSLEPALNRAAHKAFPMHGGGKWSYIETEDQKVCDGQTIYTKTLLYSKIF